jgi:hypothetical protein
MESTEFNWVADDANPIRIATSEYQKMLCKSMGGAAVSRHMAEKYKW